MNCVGLDPRTSTGSDCANCCHLCGTTATIQRIGTGPTIHLEILTDASYTRRADFTTKTAASRTTTRAREPPVEDMFLSCILCSIACKLYDRTYLLPRFYYRAAWNATRYSDGNSVCPSVRLSVCPSVCLSNACIVTKRKKAVLRFLYHMKEHLS